VFNTPQLLMLSGIGDPAELRSLGIPTRVNLPSVGKNMSDHVLLGNPWRVNNNETFDTYLAPDVLPQRIQEWNRTHQGPLSWTVNSQVAWLRLPQNDTIIQTHGDPSPGPTSAHYQFIWSNGWVAPGFSEPEGSWMTIASNLISPTSRMCTSLCLSGCLTLITFGQVERSNSGAQIHSILPSSIPIICLPTSTSKRWSLPSSLLRDSPLPKPGKGLSTFRGSHWGPQARTRRSFSTPGTTLLRTSFPWIIPLRINVTGRFQGAPRRRDRGDISAWGPMGCPRPGLESQRDKGASCHRRECHSLRSYRSQ